MAGPTGSAALGIGAGIVLDTGSFCIKAGLVSEMAPRVSVRTLLLRDSSGSRMFAGADAIEEASTRGLAVHDVSRPVERGCVHNWNDVEALWAYCFQQLDVNPSEHCVLVTEQTVNAKSARERSAQVLFETFDVPAMYSCIQGQLALFAAGEVTGTVLESGDGVTHAVPVVNGYVHHEGAVRLPYGGRDVTEHVLAALLRDGLNVPPLMALETADLVKRQLGSLCGGDFTAERRAAARLPFTLPDGRVVHLGAERLDCGEALFAPAVMGIESMGAHEAVWAAACSVDMETRPALLASVVISGGNSCFAGATKRMRQELKALVPGSTPIAVSQPGAPETAVWLGGKIVASMPIFEKMAVQKAAYAEWGPNFIHRKCM